MGGQLALNTRARSAVAGVRLVYTPPEWEAKPTGDGTRLEAGRAQALHVQLVRFPPDQAVAQPIAILIRVELAIGLKARSLP